MPYHILVASLTLMALRTIRVRLATSKSHQSRLATSIWYGIFMKNCFKDWSQFKSLQSKTSYKYMIWHIDDFLRTGASLRAFRVRLATSIWYGILMKNCFKDWSQSKCNLLPQRFSYSPECTFQTQLRFWLLEHRFRLPSVLMILKEVPTNLGHTIVRSKEIK